VEVCEYFASSSKYQAADCEKNVPYFENKIMTKPVISIIVPVYKTEKYIVRCLESLVNQTFRDIEIICVNDGSPDNAPAICADYAQKDSRIILLAQSNQGLSAARNTGLFHARGEYIQFCDSDDYYDTTMCEKLYNSVIASGADLAMVGIKIVYEDGIPAHPGDDEYHRIKFSGLHKINSDVFQKTDVYAWNKIFKKKIIDEYDIRFPTGLKYEDACFFFKYLFVAKYIFYLDEPLYNYVRRTGSIMYITLYQKTPMAIDHVNILYDIEVFMEKHGLTRKYTSIFVWMILSYANCAIWDGTEAIYQEVFEKCTALLKEIDFNKCMAENYDKDDVIRLYALKKNDRDLYFSVDKAIIEWNSLVQERDSPPSGINNLEKPGRFIYLFKSCLLFPWYLYKTYRYIYRNPVKQLSLKQFIKSYLFFPDFVLKAYLGAAEKCGGPGQNG
jgi:glycosyltransferase involved in cell wall biosynthesis